MLSPLIYNKYEYKLNDDLINFLNNHINKIIIDDKKLDYNRIIQFMIRIYQARHCVDPQNYNQQIEHLENMKSIEYKKYIEAYNRYLDFHRNHYLPNKTSLLIKI